VARTFERLGDTRAPPPAALRSSLSPSGPSEQSSRFELFDAVAAWLMELAAMRPLFIGLEDLHAADPESLALLEALTVSLRSTRVLIVATVRDTALASGPLSDWYQRIQRQARSLTLTRLDPETGRELLLSELESADEGFVQRALEVTHGHPLFLVELVRLVRLRGAESSLDELLPASVESVYRQRIEQLSEATLDVLARCASESRARL
jgi:predicted ATPase